MICKLNGWMDNYRYYMEIKRVDGKGGIMICKLKGQMIKGVHYKVEMKGWIEKEAL